MTVKFLLGLERLNAGDAITSGQALIVFFTI